jgi:carbonic anhydrase
MRLSHRLALAVSALLILACLASCGTGSSSVVSAAPEAVAPTPSGTLTAAVPTPTDAPIDAASALQQLKDGNYRYVTGNNYCYNRVLDRPLELNSIQHPKAIIIGCSDSRVDPQLCFDQPWGELFVGRVAGNVAEDYILGSTEYAVSVLQTKLIVVLGHEGCGAVSAAVDGTPLTGHLAELIALIEPAVQSVQGQPGDELENAIIANIQQSVAQVVADPVVAQGIASGQVEVLGALYHLQNGVVTFME